MAIGIKHIKIQKFKTQIQNFIFHHSINILLLKFFASRDESLFFYHPGSISVVSTFASVGYSFPIAFFLSAKFCNKIFSFVCLCSKQVSHIATVLLHGLSSLFMAKLRLG